MDWFENIAISGIGFKNFQWAKSIENIQAMFKRKEKVKTEWQT